MTLQGLSRTTFIFKYLKTLNLQHVNSNTVKDYQGPVGTLFITVRKD